MARAQQVTEAETLARRILALPDAAKVKILSQVMLAEGEEVSWADVEAIQRRVSTALAKRDESPEDVDRLVVQTVRDVRRERRRRRRG
jgi:hypothetical protein